MYCVIVQVGSGIQVPGPTIRLRGDLGTPADALDCRIRDGCTLLALPYPDSEAGILARSESAGRLQLEVPPPVSGGRRGGGGQTDLACRAGRPCSDAGPGLMQQSRCHPTQQVQLQAGRIGHRTGPLSPAGRSKGSIAPALLPGGARSLGAHGIDSESDSKRSRGAHRRDRGEWAESWGEGVRRGSEGWG